MSVRKHQAILAALFVGATLAMVGRAEDEGPANQTKQQKVRELLKLTGAAQQGLQVMDTMLEQFKQMPGVTPGFVKEFKKLAKPREFVELLVPVYLKHLDEETLDATIAFFKTPAGRKFIKAQQNMLPESMVIGSRWGKQLAKKAMRKLRQGGRPGVPNPPAAEDFERQKTRDLNNVRNLIGLLVVARSIPMKDGRVDVFALLRQPSLLKSARFGYGPSKQEIKQGDYKNFPYERFRGAIAQGRTVPLLWDKKPDRKNGRVVGFTGGAVKYYPEAKVQELLKRHGQLEPAPAPAPKK